MGNWSVIDKLHQVTVPTLVIHGRADIAQDYVVAPFFENLPKCKWITMEKCSHMPFWEDRAQFMKYVEQFLQLKF
jgi:pimeloyl-ACP methyl ester carboxylesterase